MNKDHEFNYEWSLKDAVFTKDKGTVFSCFSCGGGSTMGYKLAGFDVIGCNEIDPKMMEVYKANHNPKYSYLESITTFKDRDDLPEDLYNLDILDGSPPCSSFSMAGNREKDWGKEKVFREGQQKQVLDTLFFDFIDLGKKLQPKIIIAENVKGLLQGEAFKYVLEIYRLLEEAGYIVQHWLLDASVMGVPQKRQRVFFIAVRKDISEPFIVQKDLFLRVPELKLNFNEKPITYGEIQSKDEDGLIKVMPCVSKLWDKVQPGEGFDTVHERGSMFNCYKTNPEKPLKTILSVVEQKTGAFNHEVLRSLSKSEVIKGQSFPYDYNFLELNPYYVCGMSVPPVMMAQIAKQVSEQWLKKLK